MPLERLSLALERARAARLHWEGAYDRMVEGLRQGGAGRAAPQVGDRIAEFGLPDGEGRWVRLSDLLKTGPLVLSFQRGGWCPYCTAEMQAWAAHAEALRALGGTLAVVTPETGGRALQLAAKAGPLARLLVDVDHGVAMALGLTVPLPEEIAERYRVGGLDLDLLTGGAGRFVPIPATFAIGQDARVRFAFADPDFRRRAEPAEVLAALG